MYKKIGVTALVVAALFAGRATATHEDYDMSICGIVDPRGNVATWFIGGKQGQAVYVDRGKIIWAARTGPIPVFVKRMVTRMEGTSVRIKCKAA